MAILSVIFEAAFEIFSHVRLEHHHLIGATIAYLVACPLVLTRRYGMIGLAIFSAALIVTVYDQWAAYYNHGWLTLWTIPPALAFGAAWTRSVDYRWYLRATLGVVMLAACAQKILAGTYFDGTFITYLSNTGSTTERMFGPLCASTETPCFAHKAIGSFIVVWQAAVGILLLAGVKSLIFLFVEISFLLGAGLYADEMNFQVLNICLLCIAFGYGMRPWLATLCIALLAIDAYSISAILDHVF